MPGDGRTLRHEASAAGRDHDDRRDDLGAGIGRQLPAAVGQLLSALAICAEMECRLERLDLLQQPVGQFLAGDDRQTRNVVDRLLGIELGALPARPVEDVDQMAFEIEQPKLEHREQPDRACSDDGDVGLDGCS